MTTGRINQVARPHGQDGCGYQNAAIPERSNNNGNQANCQFSFGTFREEWGTKMPQTYTVSITQDQ